MLSSKDVGEGGGGGSSFLQVGVEWIYSGFAPTATISCTRRLSDAGKGAAKDTGSTYEQQYVSSVIELHDKYLQYVVGCFSNSSPFHKALKEAFESFCNKAVAGCTSAELMATFCNNLLKKVPPTLHSPLCY